MLLRMPHLLSAFVLSFVLSSTEVTGDLTMLGVGKCYKCGEGTDDTTSDCSGMKSGPCGLDDAAIFRRSLEAAGMGYETVFINKPGELDSHNPLQQLISPNKTHIPVVFTPTTSSTMSRTTSKPNKISTNSGGGSGSGSMTRTGNLERSLEDPHGESRSYGGQEDVQDDVYFFVCAVVLSNDYSKMIKNCFYWSGTNAVDLEINNKTECRNYGTVNDPPEICFCAEDLCNNKEHEGAASLQPQFLSFLFSFHLVWYIYF